MHKPPFPIEILTALAQAQHIAILTGAGVSAESGIPTFREAQTGLWAQYRPEDLATREAFARNPERIWEWYCCRRRVIAQAEPNAGHFALAQLEQSARAFTLITQNIDALHQAAGSHHVLELHGSIWRARCFDHDHPYAGSLDCEITPTCAECGSLVRPDIVWFGEALPMSVLDTAMEAARACDVFLTIGTSGLVQPAASLPMLALEHGALCIEINAEPTPLTNWMSHSLRGKSGEILPALLEAASTFKETKK